MLTAGTFALSVAEVGSRSVLEPGRYHSLWLPCVLAAIAVIADIGHRGWIGSEPSARR